MIDAFEVDTHTVVLGAGTGGATLAGLLVELGDETVTLVEAGPDYGPLGAPAWPADMLDARAVPLSHDWGLTSETTYPDRVLDFPRAKIIGGCSAHNGCTAAVGAHADWDGWAAAGNPGWAAAEIEPVLDLVRGRFRVSQLELDEITPIQRAFVDAGLGLGLPLAQDLDELTAGVGVGPMTVNVVDGVRINSAFAFLDPVRANPLLTISDRTLVNRILIRDGRAVGVQVVRDGREYAIRAKRVVLASGAYGSPCVLQRSGIGPRELLESLGIAVIADLPGVGRNLLDHPCVALDFRGSEAFHEQVASLASHPDEQSVARARSSRCDDGPYDIHLFMVAGANTGHPGLPPISLYGGAMRAQSQGVVAIRSADPADLPLIDHRYLSDPDGHDLAVLTEALELLEDLAGDHTLAAFNGERVTPTDVDIAAHVVNYCHPAGSCRMGAADDPMAVTNANGGVHGVGGLYVADASLMPSITRGNPNLPIAAIAAKVAASLLGLTPETLAEAARTAREPG